MRRLRNRMQVRMTAQEDGKPCPCLQEPHRECVDKDAVWVGWFTVARQDSTMNLGISCAMLVWAARHPQAPLWPRAGRASGIKQALRSVSGDPRPARRSALGRSETGAPPTGKMRSPTPSIAALCGCSTAIQRHEIGRDSRLPDEVAGLVEDEAAIVLQRTIRIPKSSWRHHRRCGATRRSQIVSVVIGRG